MSGNWRESGAMPPHADVLSTALKEPRASRISFDTRGLTGWDSRLLNFLVHIVAQRPEGVELDRSGLPEGVRRLLDLAFATGKKDTGRLTAVPSWLARVGASTLEWLDASRGVLTFIGDATISFVLLLAGRARFRRSDLSLTIQECGAQALPIVSLISFLVGLILAFVGAMQLRMFAAEIYTANLVAVAMAREMSAIMTGIIMAGRTGAAFAAQLGTMTVTEEIDALKTLGFSPMEFLVLPRMLALLMMMPLLCLYSDLMGILGGFVVAVGMLGITPELYYNQTIGSLRLTSLAIGVVKCSVFGAVVALSGCLRGMQCGRSSAAVGTAATSAVVTAIVWIIALDAVFAVITDILGI
jgi:phospholipid/cholesterol/gamma-HCH transport system permease protein